MTQSSLFNFFTAPGKTAPPPSPATKKATAIRSLKKVVDGDADFQLEDEPELSDASESEYSSYSSSSESDVEDKIEPKKLTKKTIQKANVPKAAPKKKPPITLSKGLASNPKKRNISLSDAGSTTSSTENLRAAADECELPDWLTTNLMDANKNKPDSEKYDPTTVYVPSYAENSFTPFQQQFWDIKRNHFDAIVMIRKGKFYEMFSVDAIFARDVLKLRLTNRGKEPMCGIPDRAFSEWAIKIIHSGKRVCKVEQVETVVDQRNRKSGPKSMQRELVQIYSLGTIDDFEMLEGSQPSFLLSIHSVQRDKAGLCLVDCSTGSFYLGVVPEDILMDILIRFEPVEVVFSKASICPQHYDIIRAICGNCVTRAKASVEWADARSALSAIQRIAEWDEVPEVLSNFGPESISALGGCVSYLKDSMIAKPLLSLERFYPLDEAGGEKYLSLDSSALTNLQIISSTDKCLLNLINFCKTSFGRRRLRFWVMHPLRSISAINERFNAVQAIMENDIFTDRILKQMSSMPDLERILSRVYSNRCNIRVFLDCLNSLEKATHIFTSLESSVGDCELLRALCPKGRGESIRKQLAHFMEAIDIEKANQVNEFVIKPGIYSDIDDIEKEIQNVEGEFQEILRDVRHDLHCKNVTLVDHLSERYLIVVPIEYADNVDDSYTLTSSTKSLKRYRIPATKELLIKLEDLENQRLKLRSGCQERFIGDFAKSGVIWDQMVDALSDLDCLYSLAIASQRWDRRCRPEFVTNEKAVLKIKQMRHPYIATDVIPNDIEIGDRSVLLITGPNASGKSTFARMCCIAIVLAQIGCFLPAESAKMTVFDQIFTRIGAGDRLFSGQSTFAVELNETARLIKYSTANSFVVLDELGRGTSTFDGIAIATAVLEHFIKIVHCPVVFCTHYHVLAQQFRPFECVQNASMDFVIGNKLTLLYKLVPRPCSSSFGCEVAALCGLSKKITTEAQEVANEFERQHKALHAEVGEHEVKVIEPPEEMKLMIEKLKSAIAPNDDLLKAYQRVWTILTDVSFKSISID